MYHPSPGASCQKTASVVVRRPAPVRERKAHREVTAPGSVTKHAMNEAAPTETRPDLSTASVILIASRALVTIKST